MPDTAIYFAWTAFQRRQVSMARYFGFQNLFMPIERRKTRFSKLITYIRHSWSMLSILRRERPSVVWIQLPQVPLLWVALLFRRFFQHDIKIVADCHNAMFRPPWSKVPFGVSMLSQCDIVLAHNMDVMATARGLGVDHTRLFVVEDPPATFPTGTSLSFKIELPRPWFVFPASFADDEPIAELLDAARKVPDVTVLITGDSRRCKEQNLIEDAPHNVSFLGYLSRGDFEALIVNCDGVVAFTRFEGIQLSVCGEAVGCGKPMLTSDTSTLRALFPTGTCFVDSASPLDIARGLRLLATQTEKLSAEMLDLRAKFLADWLKNRCQPLAHMLQPAKSVK